MSEIDVIELLDNVSKIYGDYKSHIEKTGERFNIFKILNVETKEVRLHSKFISELLDPNGSHGRGNLFLQYFLTQFGFSDRAFDTLKVSVEIEKYIGVKTDSTGGYLDIILTDQQRHVIIIENKIYAGDGENQLLRYFNFCKNGKYDFSLYPPIIYLSLFGKDPEDKSKKDLKLNQDYNVKSYENDILKWLQKCKESCEESEDLHWLNSTISQYINLVKILTHQTKYEIMKDKIAKLISEKSDFVDAAFLIEQSLEGIKRNLTCTFRGQIVELFEGELKEIYKDLIYHVSEEEKFGSFESVFYISLEKWRKNNFCLCFEFSDDEMSLDIGICKLDQLETFEKKIGERMREEFFTELKQYSENWIVFDIFKEWEETKWNEMGGKLEKKMIITAVKSRIIHMAERLNAIT